MAKTTIVAPLGVPQILISREFAASRELLFRAHTEPDLLVQWIGPRRLTMTVDHLDVLRGEPAPRAIPESQRAYHPPLHHERRGQDRAELGAHVRAPTMFGI